MTSTFAIITLLVFVTISLIVLAIVGRTEPARLAVRRRMAAAASPYGVGRAVQAEMSRPFFERVIAPILEAIGRRLVRLAPASVAENARARLDMAGRRTTTAYWGFFAAQAAFIVGLPLLYWVAVRVITQQWPSGLIPLLVTLVLMVVGWRLPDYWLDFTIGARKGQIVKNLPDAMDLLTICVEAGLGLDAAFAMVAEKFTGPLAEEIGLTMYEISFGKRRREALQDLSRRTQVSELTTFITAIVRAEQTGMNVGDVLRVQADGMRVRRRQRAQEQAQQAPVKMLFPLILGIFPALFIVILAPALIRALALLLR